MISEQFFPLVSIIIPVYNGSDYLAEAVDSALNQTYKNIEVIVINDGSNDDGQTENIALLYGNKIRYIRKENGGVASALNLGISLMKGEYFSWLSHDDLYSNNKISKQIKILASISDKTTILYSGYKLLTPESRERGIFNPKLYYPEDKLNQSLFPLFRGLINGCTLLIHKSHFDRIGYFDESLLSTQDMDLWFKMFRNQNIKYCDNQEVKTRIHDNQGSKTINTHNEECSKLWINMIKSVDTEEMKEMFGSEGAFYNETILFLTKHTDYKAAIDFMKDKVPDYYMYNSVFNKCSLRLILNKIRLLYYKIKYDGLLVTLKKVRKMIFRRII